MKFGGGPTKNRPSKKCTSRFLMFYVNVICEQHVIVSVHVGLGFYEEQHNLENNKTIIMSIKVRVLTWIKFLLIDNHSSFDSTNCFAR